MQGKVPTIGRQSGTQKAKTSDFWLTVLKRLKQDKYLYSMLLPVIGFYVLFKYVPMVGEIIAFKNYRFVDGIFGSPMGWIQAFPNVICKCGFLENFEKYAAVKRVQSVFRIPGADYPGSSIK
ncbi:hypothetical protein [Paenibacillus sp. N3.4]|uniref:hypothetical protein n=1 Tax=Paenibacillus sp. N3.4 TaxID=2603222 RepID=UPI0021C2BFE6|nr:hypothetical protein [Paenibacillus sp. N3.4]